MLTQIWMKGYSFRNLPSGLGFFIGRSDFPIEGVFGEGGEGGLLPPGEAGEGVAAIEGLFGGLEVLVLEGEAHVEGILGVVQIVSLALHI